jgi:cytochrome P450
MTTKVDSVPQSDEAPFLDVIDPDFSFTSPEVMAAQERSWYANSPIGVLVLRYPEAYALLRDQRLAANGKRFMEMNDVSDGPIYDWFVPMIANQSGADHTRLRGLVSKVFTPRMVDGLRPFIRAKVEQLTEVLVSKDECDFIEDFGNPLPLTVMCELLGVPPADYDAFRVWTTDVGLVFSLAYGGDIRERVETALVGLGGYIESLMADKTGNPGEDLISALVAARDDADSRVSAVELRNLLITLIFGAHDATRHQLSNAMVTFAEHPDQWTLLGSRPELAGQAIEEVMRWRPSTPTLGRFATNDLDYQGLHIPKDTFLAVCVTPAQRDPRVFRDGDTFDITVTREAVNLQFGAGPHYCIGAVLAKAEITEAISYLSSRLGPPVVTGPVTWRPPVGIHGPNGLPLRFSPVGQGR